MKYWISPKIKWRTFKNLNDKLYEGRDSGPTPEHGDTALWEGLRDRYFNLFVDTKNPSDPLCITVKTPPRNARFINNP